MSAVSCFFNYDPSTECDVFFPFSIKLAAIYLLRTRLKREVITSVFFLAYLICVVV